MGRADRRGGGGAEGRADDEDGARRQRRRAFAGVVDIARDPLILIEWRLLSVLGVVAL